MDVLSALRKVTTSIKTWADSKLETKLDKNLGTDNIGKVIAVDASGNISPSNTHTIDNDGNSWFAGNVKVGGTGQDDSNAKQLATLNDIESRVASLVNSAPETLDTLNELAEALGNDPNFATTVATEIGKKVDKVDGKGLSTNDYTNEEKEKLNNISPSDWDSTEGSTQILNKPTKLSQFEGEMTAEEQSAVRKNIGINELSSNEVYVMDESDTEADIPESAELIIIPSEDGEPVNVLKGDKGDPFTYEDFTPEQLASLKGDKGDSFTYSDFTPEQLSLLKGEKGDIGITPNLSIGEVTTVAPIESASATITGTTENPILNLSIPKGNDGDGSTYRVTYGNATIDGQLKDNVFTMYETKDGVESVKSQFIIEGGSGSSSGGSYRATYGKTIVDGELKDNIFTLYETVDGVESVKSQFVIEGGGSGSTTAKTEITLKKVTPSPVIISTNGKAEVEVEYSSVDKNGETYDAIYTWTKDSKVLETGALVQGKKKFNLTKYISLGTQKLVLTVVDDTGNTDSQTWTIQQVDMRIKSSFNDNNTFPISRSVAYTFTPYGAIDKTVHFELDGVEDTMSVSSTGTPLSYTIPPQSHGAHSFKVWMTATDIPDLKTECLYYDIIWFDSGLTEPIISCIYRNDFYGTVDVRQYDTTSIKYTVYDPTTDSPIVKRYADGELVNTDTLTKPTNEWKFKSDKIGEHTLIIEVGDNTEDGGWIVRDSVTIVMNINPLGIDVTPITANLEVDFNPIGITNNSSNRVWSNEKYHMTVSDNFDWINGGYRTDENGDTYFLVKAGTEAVLHYNIFSGDNSSSPSALGAEMKVIFKTENVQKADAVWLTSVEQNEGSIVGLQMGVHEGWLKTNTASNVDVVGDSESDFVAATNTYLYMPYSEEDIIEMDINIDPIDREASNPQAFVMAYEDGVPSKAFVYGSSDRFYHFEPKPITIGSNDCDVRIYRLKIYSSSLSTEDVMKNFIADSRDSTTMLQRYDRNSIYYDRETDTYTPYSSGGILDPEKLAPMIPNVKVLMLETDHFTTSKKTFVKSKLRCIHASGGDKYSGDPYYDNWLFENGWHAGQGTTSDNYGNAGRNVDFLFNCDGTHKPSDKVSAEEGYISQITLGYGTDNPTTESVTDWKGDNGKVDLTRTSVPNNFFNLKVNIASSENANNALLQKRYNDYLPYISPAKKRDSKIKNDMEFVPAILFLKETNPDIDTHNEFLDNEWHFYALGNIGDSKKTDYTRAYDPDDMSEFTIEISDNTKNNATFQTGIESLGDGQYRMETFKLIKTLDKDGEVVLTPIAYTPVRNHILNIPESIVDEYWNARGEIVVENNTGNPEYDGNEFGYLNMRRWCLENEGFDGDHSFEPRYACCGDYRDGKLVNDTSGRGKAQVKLNNDVWRAFYKWVITSTDDEFKNELDQWCVRSAVEFFYAFTHIYTMMDNRAKNTFWHFAKTGTYREVNKPVKELLHVYCELIDGEYVTTSDTEVHSDKTYYTQYAFDLWQYDTDTALGIKC